MISKSLVICLLVVLFLPCAFAALDDPIIFIHAPDEVAADTPFEAKIDVEEHNLDTTYSYAFRIYLATRAREGDDQRLANPLFYHIDCYLLWEQTLCDSSIEIASDYILYKNTSFTVTIPASVGPSGKYVLKLRTLQTDGSYYSSQLESNVFALTGGTGEWAEYQLQGQSLWGDDGIPCSAYSCVRDNCAGPSSGEMNSTYEECANACPDVSIDPSSSRGGQPTAPLTTPTPCPTQVPTGRTTPDSSWFGAMPTETATRLRSAAAVAPTNAASPLVKLRPSTSFVIIGIILLIGMV